jgi:transcriptional regulator with XRE-family HTH domain
MQDTAIAQRMRQSLKKPYDPTALVGRLLELLKQHNESYREAALKGGMDHQAVRRILSGQRPSLVTCILMADHFGLNPNEFLLLAGLPTLNVFDIQTESTEALPIEAVDVAKAVAKIQNPKQRKEVSQAILTLLTQYFD